jgi:hypothetical protein
MSPEELESLAKTMLLNEPLLSLPNEEEESKEMIDEDELRRKAITVEDYEDEEIEDDDR